MTKIALVIEFLNNMLYLGSAYNQIWTIEPVNNSDGKPSIAIIDERNGKVKMKFCNEDDAMKEAINFIHEKGWYQARQICLPYGGFVESRVLLTEKE